MKGPFVTTIALLPGHALAHVAMEQGASVGWNLEPWLVFLLAGFAWLFVHGARRLAGRSERQRHALRRRALLFMAGIACLVVALVSPLDALAERLVSAHMVQHMLLIIAAAPLLVLAAPLPVFLWALPASWRHSVSGVTRNSLFANVWQLLTVPLVAWLLHGAFLWLWHVPSLYQAALRNAALHDLEHFSFLANALLFWWVVLRSLSRRGTHNATALLLLFTTFVHGGLLAALMSFSAAPWYPVYADTATAWGLTPIRDQQLAGLIMWLPAGITYLVAGLSLLGLWMHRLEHASSSPHPGMT